MNTDLSKARSLLEEGAYTCVLCKGQVTHTSDLRGVAPLLQLLDSGADVRGFSAADKVVGKATAYLYCLLGVRSVYARVVSQAAVEVLQSAGIGLSYDVVTAGIQNRTQTGSCPMETATLSCRTPEEALAVIRQTVERLRNPQP